MIRKFVVIIFLCGVLAACSTTSRCITTSNGPWCAAPLPTTPLFFEQQQSVIVTRKDEAQQLLATVQWTPEAIDQTVMSPMGQTLYRLRFSQGKIEFERGALPFVMDPAYALLDMQLMVWPYALLSEHLPKGWSLVETDSPFHRKVLKDNELLIEIIEAEDGSRELIHYQRSYRVKVTPLVTRKHN